MRPPTPAVRSGFDHVPGGPEYANRSVFSYHYYCASFVPGYNHEPYWTKNICDHALVRKTDRSPFVVTA